MNRIVDRVDPKTGEVISRRVVKDFVGESMTEQHHRKDVNINNIVRRYKKTGLLPNYHESGTYGDFTNVGDFHECVDRVYAAQAGFDSLPAHLRKRFENDPAKLIAFLADDKNRQEAIELGLLERPLPVTVEPDGDPQDPPPAE